MEKYSIYCTSEQTKKALELGAPIRYKDTLDNRERGKFEIPTAEQMIGWLEDNIRGVITISKNWHQGCMKFDWVIFDDFETIIEGSIVYYNSRKEATLAAIDASLEYLISKKN